MLLLTISLRKRRGELRGESLGDVAPLFPPTPPGIFGGSSSRCMCSLNVRMQESISTLNSLDDIPTGWVQSFSSSFKFSVQIQSHQLVIYSRFCPPFALSRHREVYTALKCCRGKIEAAHTHAYNHEKAKEHIPFCCLGCFACAFSILPLFPPFLTGLGISQSAVVQSPSLFLLAHAPCFSAGLLFITGF